MLTARWSLLRFASALGSAGRGGEIGAGSGDWGAGAGWWLVPGAGRAACLPASPRVGTSALKSRCDADADAVLLVDT